MQAKGTKALAANCGAGDISDRQARHLLESLEQKHFIRRFAKKRGHGNYPVLVNKYEVTWGAHKGMRLNAARTTNWRQPVYEFRQECGLEEGTGNGVGEGEFQGEAHAPFRERELRKQRKKKQKNATSAAASVQFSPGVIKAFQSLGCEQSFGSAEFQAIWSDEYAQTEQSRDPHWTDAMERTICRCQSNQITVPSLFFSHKRKIEAAEVEYRYHSTPI